MWKGSREYELNQRVVSITRNATSGTFNSSLLSERSRRSAFLAPRCCICHFRLVVKGGDFSRELFDDLRRQRAPRGEGIRAARHRRSGAFRLRRRRVARAIERESAIRLAGDAPRGNIERRRGAPVERDFALAHREPLWRRRKIEIGKGDRALQFEGARSAQDDARNMRRNNLAAAVERGEKAQRLFLSASTRLHRSGRFALRNNRDSAGFGSR